MLDAAVVIADEAALAIDAVASNADYLAVERAIKALEFTAEAHPVFDPPYPAGKPPFLCRVCYGGHFGIFYTIKGDVVTVLSVKDMRRNPLAMFDDGW